MKNSERLLEAKKLVDQAEELLSGSANYNCFHMGVSLKSQSDLLERFSEAEKKKE